MSIYGRMMYNEEKCNKLIERVLSEILTNHEFEKCNDSTIYKIISDITSFLETYKSRRMIRNYVVHTHKIPKNGVNIYLKVVHLFGESHEFRMFISTD